MASGTGYIHCRDPSWGLYILYNIPEQYTNFISFQIFFPIELQGSQESFRGFTESFIEKSCFALIFVKGDIQINLND